MGTHLDNAPYDAGNVRDSTSVPGTKLGAIQHGRRHENQDEPPQWLDNIKQSALGGRETKSNDDERQLLGRVVRKLVEEHVEANSSCQ